MTIEPLTGEKGNTRQQTSEKQERQHHFNHRGSHQSSPSFGPQGRTANGGRKRISKNAVQEESNALQSLQASAPPPADGGGDRIVRSAVAAVFANGPTVPSRTADVPTSRGGLICVNGVILTLWLQMCQEMIVVLK